MKNDGKKVPYSQFSSNRNLFLCSHFHPSMLNPRGADVFNYCFLRFLGLLGGVLGLGRLLGWGAQAFLGASWEGSWSGGFWRDLGRLGAWGRSWGGS